eukprot:gnl/Dysnectes_brevis/1380_a1552_1089.p1 GENE.gnl/Dysnectes_brevis/1380_a1552_1089~~gnl/Dysnectes_brevis/1380_a1552_1089.p1  ORF type:complete len:536 (+),score=188.98 gnl/Dysnectes_brevis/1380_a1552_1089:167-1774(+)
MTSEPHSDLDSPFPSLDIERAKIFIDALADDPTSMNRAHVAEECRVIIDSIPMGLSAHKGESGFPAEFTKNLKLLKTNGLMEAIFRDEQRALKIHLATPYFSRLARQFLLPPNTREIDIAPPAGFILSPPTLTELVRAWRMDECNTMDILEAFNFLVKCVGHIDLSRYSVIRNAQACMTQLRGTDSPTCRPHTEEDMVFSYFENILMLSHFRFAKRRGRRSEQPTPELVAMLEARAHDLAVSVRGLLAHFDWLHVDAMRMPSDLTPPQAREMRTMYNVIFRVVFSINGLSLPWTAHQDSVDAVTRGVVRGGLANWGWLKRCSAALKTHLSLYALYAERSRDPQRALWRREALRCKQALYRLPFRMYQYPDHDPAAPRGWGMVEAWSKAIWHQLAVAEDDAPLVLRRISNPMPQRADDFLADLLRSDETPSVEGVATLLAALWHVSWQTRHIIITLALLCRACEGNPERLGALPSELFDVVIQTVQFTPALFGVRTRGYISPRDRSQLPDFLRRILTIEGSNQLEDENSESMSVDL